MTELIKGLAQVKDALTLIAFLALVLLVAFRTTKVPELFFGLVKEKVTRAEFARLLHRFMALGFSSFVALVALAALGQYFNHTLQPGVLSVGDFRTEISSLKEDADHRLEAERQYMMAISLINQKKTDEAISALRSSIDQVPTLTARYTLAVLYQQQGKPQEMSAVWKDARQLAEQRRDSLALARLDNLEEGAGTPVSSAARPPDSMAATDLMYARQPLAQGSSQRETATTVAPGLYLLSKDRDGLNYVRVWVKFGQTLTVKYRSPDDMRNKLVDFEIQDSNGGNVGGIDDWGNLKNRVFASSWRPPGTGWAYLKITGPAGTVFRIAAD